MGYALRDYQEALLDQTRLEIRRGNNAPLLVLPTGGGKTRVFCQGIIMPAVAKGLSVIIVVNRKQLVRQACDDLERLGVHDYGVLQANHPRTRYHSPVQVASKDTLIHRMDFLRHEPDIIIIDEAHHVTDDNTYSEIRKRWPNAIVIGFTATPCRLDGKPLGAVFNAMVCGPGIKDLIEQRYLVPPTVFAGKPADVTGLKKSGGDWNQKQLAARTDTDELVGDIVETWKAHGDGRPTVAFALNIAHSKHIVANFNEEGIAAAHIDADTPDDERLEILGKLKVGEVKVCSSVGVFTEGFDCPAVGCVILGRRTESLSLYIQMGGRGLRPANGIAEEGEDCIILDHGNFTWKPGFGPLDDERIWSLSAKCRNVSEEKRRACKNCGANVPPNLPLCPACGSAMRNGTGKQTDLVGDIPMGDGTILQAVAREEVEAHKMKERRTFFREMAEHGWTNKWTAARVHFRFKERFKEYPKRADQEGSRIQTRYRYTEPGKGAWEFVDTAEQGEMAMEVEA